MVNFVLFWIFCGVIMVISNANTVQLLIGTILFLLGGITIRIIGQKT